MEQFRLSKIPFELKYRTYKLFFYIVLKQQQQQITTGYIYEL